MSEYRGKQLGVVMDTIEATRGADGNIYESRSALERANERCGYANLSIKELREHVDVRRRWKEEEQRKLETSMVEEVMDRAANIRLSTSKDIIEKI